MEVNDYKCLFRSLRKETKNKDVEPEKILIIKNLKKKLETNPPPKIKSQTTTLTIKQTKIKTEPPPFSN